MRMKISNCLPGTGLTLSLFIIILLSLIQLGCNAYKSPYPISQKGETPLDQDLLGLWVDLSEPGETDTLNTPEKILMIYKWDEHNFMLLDHQLSDYDDYMDEQLEFKHSWNLLLLNDLTKPPYKIWNSIVDSTELINVQELGQDSQYMVFQYTANKDSLELSILSNELKFKPESSEELQSYIIDNRDTFYAYMETYRSYSRMEEVLWRKVNPLDFSNAFRKTYFFPSAESVSEDSLKKYSNKIFDKFMEAEITELLDENTASLKNMDSLLIDLNDYHMDILDFEIDSSAEFFILQSGENYNLKLIKTASHLVDVTHFIGYKKRE